MKFSAQHQREDIAEFYTAWNPAGANLTVNQAALNVPTVNGAAGAATGPIAQGDPRTIFVRASIQQWRDREARKRGFQRATRTEVEAEFNRCVLLTDFFARRCQLAHSIGKNMVPQADGKR
jgi:hypothetical protein